MAPHPVVQAIIDLSAGAIGKCFVFQDQERIWWIWFLWNNCTACNCFNKHLTSYMRPGRRFWWLLCFSSSFIFVFSLTVYTAQWSEALSDSNPLSAHVLCTLSFFWSLYNSRTVFCPNNFDVDCLLLSVSEGELHVFSAGSLWTQRRSRCRPSLQCTAVSSTASCPPTNKWVCAGFTRAPRQHWWPTLPRTLCFSWATASASRSSASQLDCTMMLCWGVCVCVCERERERLSVLLPWLYADNTVHVR